MQDTGKLSIEERLKLEIELINDFKEVVGFMIRGEISKNQEIMKLYNQTLESAKDLTKAPKAYTTRFLKRIMRATNNHLRKLNELHLDLFIDNGDDDLINKEDENKVTDDKVTSDTAKLKEEE